MKLTDSLCSTYSAETLMTVTGSVRGHVLFLLSRTYLPMYYVPEIGTGVVATGTVCYRDDRTGNCVAKQERVIEKWATTTVSTPPPSTDFVL